MNTPDPGTDPITPEDTQTSLHGSQRPQESLSGDDAAEPPQDPPEQEPASTNAEAARYRKQLRKAEAERDAMAERVATYQRRECERVAASLLDQAPDLWEIGHADPADFYDGDILEEDHLRAAVAALLDMRPGLAKTARRGPRQWGQYENMPPTGGADWRTVIKPQ